MAIQNDGFGTILATNSSPTFPDGTSLSGGSNVVVWAPDSPEPPVGSYTSFVDAVAAINSLTSPTTTLQIEASVGDTVVIPAGTWQLNNTTIVGKTQGADTDTDYRGYQELLYVICETDDSNPTHLKGVVGLKDMFFRATDQDYVSASGSNGTITDVTDDVVTFTKGSGTLPHFRTEDVGKPIRIGLVNPYGGYAANESSNNGTFIITEVVDNSTIKFVNANAIVSDSNNGDIGWSKCVSPLIYTGSQQNNQLTLDNVDFRYGSNSDWGSAFVYQDASFYLHLQNAASIRWFSLTIDGYMTVQCDGSPCWVGSMVFSGNGNVDVFPTAGTQVRTFQSAISSWTLHQPYTVYLPDNESNWSSVPDTVHEALDTLASGLTSTISSVLTKRGSQSHTAGGAFTMVNNVDAIQVDLGNGSSATSTMPDGAYDEQEIVLRTSAIGVGSPTWTVAQARSGQIQPVTIGLSAVFASLGDTLTLRWSSTTNNWWITSSYGFTGGPTFA